MAPNEAGVRAGLLMLISFVLWLPSIGCSRKGTEGAGGEEKLPGGNPTEVRAVEVKSRRISRTVEVVGSLLPFEEVTVSSEVEGRVEQVYVDVGDRVCRGQILVKVAADELKYRLDEQAAALRQALAKLGLEDEAAHLENDADVPEVRRAAADLFDAEHKYRRAQELFKQALVP